LPASRLTECVIAGSGITWPGLRGVRQMWGDEAAEAARQHILSDLKMAGWRDIDPFPQSEEHYAELCLF
jgi:hypothetical protein